MKALLCTCLLWALFSTVASLRCTSCQSLRGRCVNPVSQNCAAGSDVCFSMSLTTPLLSGINLIVKSCARSANCRPGNYSSTTVQKAHSQAIMICCNTDNCNNAPLEVPQNTNVAPNRRRCPACFSVGSRGCLLQESVACLGEETQCINQAGVFSLKSGVLPVSITVAFRGCATPNSCALPVGSLRSSNNETTLRVIRLECSNATTTATTLPNGTLPNGTVPFPG